MSITGVNWTNDHLNHLRPTGWSEHGVANDDDDVVIIKGERMRFSKELGHYVPLPASEEGSKS